MASTIISLVAKWCGFVSFNQLLYKSSTFLHDIAQSCSSKLGSPLPKRAKRHCLIGQSSSSSHPNKIISHGRGFGCGLLDQGRGDYIFCGSIFVPEAVLEPMNNSDNNILKSENVSYPLFVLAKVVNYYGSKTKFWQ